MATRQALRIVGESAAEIPHMRHASLSWRPIEWREYSPRSELQSGKDRKRDVAGKSGGIKSGKDMKCLSVDSTPVCVCLHQSIINTSG